MKRPSLHIAPSADLDLFDILEHLTRGREYLQLVAIHPTKKAKTGADLIRTKSFSLTKTGRFRVVSPYSLAAEWAEEKAAEGFNLYWLVNPLENRNTVPSDNGGVWERKAKRGNIKEIDRAHLDIDPDLNAHGSYAAARKHLLEVVVPALREAGATDIHDTGNGLAAYWRLTAPLDLDAGETLNRQLLAKFGGDPGTYNADRIMRLPGLNNVPNEKKIAKGYPETPRPTRILFSNGPVWDAAELSKSLPPPLPKKLGKPGAGGKIQPLTPAEQEIAREKLAAALKASPKLANRWDGSEEGLKDDSRSGMDMSVIALLKAQGLGLTEVAYLVRHIFEYGKGPECRDYDILHAWGNVIFMDSTEAVKLVKEAGPAWATALAEKVADRSLSQTVLTQTLRALAKETDANVKDLRADVMEAIGEFEALSKEQEKEPEVETLALAERDLSGGKNVHDLLLELAEGMPFPNEEEAISAAVTVINQEFALLSSGGKTAAACWPEQPTHSHETQLQLSTIEDLGTLFSNCGIPYRGNKGKIYRVDPTKSWLQSPKRRTRIGIAFDLPERADPKRLNLFFGYGVEPKPGDWSIYWEAVRDIICGNEDDPEAATLELMKRWAWKAQNPGAPTEICDVFRGEQGAGKNRLTWQFGQMLGAAYYAEFTNPEHIFGKFNAHLANMAVVVLNEAYWRGDHKAEANLKALITDPTFIAERKFGAVAVISNSLMVIMLANARWVVPANLKNRRFRVYDVTEVHLRDFAFFKELARAMDNGGRAAMLHDMLSWDLDDWHPRMSAPTKGTQQQQALSAPAHIVWLVAALEDPTQCFSTRDSFGLRTVVKGASTWNKGPLVLGSLTDIHTAYTQWCQNNVQVWKRNSEHLDALQLMHHLKETLNTSDEPLLYQQRKRLEKMQHPTRIWCLAERPAIVKRLKSLYPGLFER